MEGLVQTGKGFYTIGIVVDKIGVLTSKNGKSFTILKLSDIVKYDLNKVKAHLAKEFSGDDVAMKTALKSYSTSGYKTISFLAFSDAALPAKNINSGTVIAILNPRLMSSSAGQ